MKRMMRLRAGRVAAALLLTAPAIAGLAISAANAECVRNIPRGDVLWIRAGPGIGFSKVGSFGRTECGIKVYRDSCRDGWCQVRKGGRTGWSHLSYLSGAEPLGQPAGGGGKVRDLCVNSCRDLWEMRNQIYKDKGYCFSTERAIRQFGNEGCYTSHPKFNNWEQRRINDIQHCEQLKGC